MAGSSFIPEPTSQQLRDVYDKIRTAAFETLEVYQGLRDKVYILKNQGEYYSCSCYVGQKKRHQCKHAILCAVIQQMFTFPPGIRDPVLQGRSRRGGRIAGARRGGARSQR
jgi:hypothetical protein